MTGLSVALCVLGLIAPLGCGGAIFLAWRALELSEAAEAESAGLRERVSALERSLAPRAWPSAQRPLTPLPPRAPAKDPFASWPPLAPVIDPFAPPPAAPATAPFAPPPPAPAIAPFGPPPSAPAVYPLAPLPPPTPIVAPSLPSLASALPPFVASSEDDETYDRVQTIVAAVAPPGRGVAAGETTCVRCQRRPVYPGELRCRECRGALGGR
jgi:hypothetical protein